MRLPLAQPAFRRHLTPERPASLPTPANVVEVRLTQGVPHPIPLGGALSLLLVVPTGIATAWREVPPGAVVASASFQTTPRVVPAAGEPREASWRGLGVAPPARLVVLRSGRLAGALPLAASTVVVIPEADDTPGPRFEIQVLDWDLRAGTLRGPGDVGSRLVVAWRPVAAAADSYDGRPLP